MASRAVPVPGPMADPGNQAATADPGAQAATADPGAQAAMEGSPPPKIFLGKLPISGGRSGAVEGELDRASGGKGELDRDQRS